MVNELVPQNLKGKPSDLECSVTLVSRAKAVNCFKRAGKRLLNPPIWHELAGWASAEFKLFGAKGGEQHRLAREGDYFQIDIPGPRPVPGDGFDWICVEKIADHSGHAAETEWIGMKVHPCANPDNFSSESVHFFRSVASSSFIIERTGNKVTAHYHGRNELPNNQTNETRDNVRNSIVDAGAGLILSKAQWSTLIKGLLLQDIGG
jgi:hypothetical protein